MMSVLQVPPGGSERGQGHIGIGGLSWPSQTYAGSQTYVGTITRDGPNISIYLVVGCSTRYHHVLIMTQSPLSSKLRPPPPPNCAAVFVLQRSGVQ